MPKRWNSSVGFSGGRGWLGPSDWQKHHLSLIEVPVTDIKRKLNVRLHMIRTSCCVRFRYLRN